MQVPLLERFSVPLPDLRQPQIETPWVVIPFSRVDKLKNVQANLSRQSHPFKVCIVENGAAVGACKAAGFKPDLLLTSDAHQSIAKNTALDALTRLDPDGYWIAMDDDDYYAEDYIREHSCAAARGTLVGKQTHFVLFEGLFLALFKPWLSNCSGHIANGATLGAYLSDSPRYAKKDIGEDSSFCTSFLSRGGNLTLSSPYYTAYCRRGREGHTYPADHESFSHAMGHQFFKYPVNSVEVISGKNLDTGHYCKDWRAADSKHFEKEY